MIRPFTPLSLRAEMLQLSTSNSSQEIECRGKRYSQRLRGRALRLVDERSVVDRLYSARRCDTGTRNPHHAEMRRRSLVRFFERHRRKLRD